MSDEPVPLVLPCEFQSADPDIEPYQCRLLEVLPVRHQGRARTSKVFAAIAILGGATIAASVSISFNSRKKSLR